MKSKSLLTLPAVAAGLLSGTVLQAAPPIHFAGGDGSSVGKAVIIQGGNEETGVHAEYDYLAKHFPGYKRGSQGLFEQGKHSYDKLNFTTARGEKKTVFFDITGLFGKMD